MVEAVIIQIAEKEIFWTWRLRVIWILSQVWWHSRDSFRAVTSKDHIITACIDTVNENDERSLILDVLPESLELGNLTWLRLLVS